MGARTVLFGVTTGASAKPFIEGQAPFLRERGWAPWLLASPYPGIERFAAREGLSFEAVELERNPSPLADAMAFRAVVRALRRIRPDVTVWGSPKASLLGTLACRLLRIPAIYIIHGLRLEGASGLTRWMLWLAEWLTCRLATVVVADGYELRQVSERLRLVRPGVARILANGSANGVPTEAPDPRYREELGLSPDAVLVGFVGRITHDKGIKELIYAWRRVADAHPEAALVVAGRPDEADPHSREMEAELRALPRTRLLGHIDDVPRLWPDLDLLVLPSYREGLPLVVIEAAAQGVPAVVSDCTGCGEAVEDGVTGIVVPARDEVAFAEALEELLDDPARRRVLGEAGRARALDRYDRTQLWAALDALLSATVAEAGGR